jgi:hypothetical protein
MKERAERSVVNQNWLDKMDMKKIEIVRTKQEKKNTEDRRFELVMGDDGRRRWEGGEGMHGYQIK